MRRVKKVKTRKSHTFSTGAYTTADGKRTPPNHIFLKEAPPMGNCIGNAFDDNNLWLIILVLVILFGACNN